MNIYMFLDALMALFSVQIVHTYLASLRKGSVQHKTGYYTLWILYFLLQYFAIAFNSANHSLLLPLTNILLMTLIQIFSGSSLKTALFCSGILGVSWMAVEAITYGLLLAVGASKEYFFATGDLLSKTALYIIIQAYRRLQGQDSGIPLPFRYWAELIFVPLLSMGTIYITRLLILHEWLNGLFVLVSVFSILINYVIFDIYEKMGAQALMTRQNQAYKQEIELCINQAAEREEAYQQTRTLRHDLKGRLIALDALLETGQLEKAKDEIVQMLEENSLNRHGIAETGNLALDALVNYKYTAALAEGIQMECHLEVPSEFFLDDTDLCVILENLLDNALEAVQKLPKGTNRKISLKIRLTKGVILITVENPYEGEIMLDSQEKIRSSKTGDHGIGLLSVERIAEKYGGTVSILHEDNIFRISVMLLQQEN